MWKNKAHLERAALFLEFQNIIAHNRTVIGNTSIRRFQQLKDKLGHRLCFDFDELRDHRQFIENSALDNDIRAATKFSLSVTNLPNPPNEGDLGMT